MHALSGDSVMHATYPLAVQETSENLLDHFPEEKDCHTDTLV